MYQTAITPTRMAKIKLSRLLVLFLLPALMWVFFNTTFNRHVHVLSDGYMITHSHPFVKNQDASDTSTSHRHTKKELWLFGLFTEIIFSVLTILVLRPCLQACPEPQIQEPYHKVPIRKNYQVHHYHAPPFSS
jgi:hypothetical protein